MGKTPKEDPQDKAARLRERRISAMERDSATQRTAGDLTSDLRSVYGLRGLPLVFGSAPVAGKPAATPAKMIFGTNNRPEGSGARYG